MSGRSATRRKAGIEAFVGGGKFGAIDLDETRRVVIGGVGVVGQCRERIAHARLTAPVGSCSKEARTVDEESDRIVVITRPKCRPRVQRKGFEK